MALPWFFSVILLTGSVVLGTVTAASGSRDGKPGKPSGNQNTFVDNSEAYLGRYGYLPKKEAHSLASHLTAEDKGKAIKNFQSYAGIRETGVIDEETVRFMEKPRCQVSDDVTNLRITRHRRFSTNGGRWHKDRVTYNVTTYTNDLPKGTIDYELRRAFKLWSDVTPLEFDRVQRGDADIEILFAEGDHGDGISFEEKGGMQEALAHAFYPEKGGDVHFNNKKHWTSGEETGKNFYQVAVHEIGHALGLAHSRHINAVMNPFYQGYNKNFRLDKDDIEGIQLIYGENSNRPRPNLPPRKPVTKTTIPTTTSTSTQEPLPSICGDGPVDTVTITADGTTYFFKGKYVWLYDESDASKTEPLLISEAWPGVTGPIDAALTYPKEHHAYTFLFKGKKYWKFYNRIPLYTEPQLIEKGFPSIPNDINDALVWVGNSGIYFFKGNTFYRYFPNNGGTTAYPMFVWRGVPTDFNGAFKWKNQRTYFFKDDKYYRFNERMLMVDAGYPLNTEKEWFKSLCQDEAHGNLRQQDMNIEINAPNVWSENEPRKTFFPESSDGSLTGDSSANIVHSYWLVLCMLLVVPFL